MYAHQRGSSKSRNHKLPSYSKEQFAEWVTTRPNFKTLYVRWVRSGYDKMKRPSVDRLEDSKGYSFDNIRLVTWEINNNKRLTDLRSGKLVHGNKPQKAVTGTHKTTNKVVKFPSASQAARELNVCRSEISVCCNGKAKSAGGYYWQFT